MKRLHTHGTSAANTSSLDMMTAIGEGNLLHITLREWNKVQY